MSVIKDSYGVENFLTKPDKYLPNNEQLPVIIYRDVLEVKQFFAVFQINRILKKNGWSNCWIDGLLTYHHYHSNTHEVLVVIKGGTRMKFGGEKGVEVEIKASDVIMIPAGVAHKNLLKEHDVICIGAYPDGKQYDMNYGHPDERPRTDENISKVLIPKKDPVFGAAGDMHHLWNSIQGKTKIYDTWASKL